MKLMAFMSHDLSAVVNFRAERCDLHFVCRFFRFTLLFRKSQSLSFSPFAGLFRSSALQIVSWKFLHSKFLCCPLSARPIQYTHPLYITLESADLSLGMHTLQANGGKSPHTHTDFFTPVYFMCIFDAVSSFLHFLRLHFFPHIQCIILCDFVYKSFFLPFIKGFFLDANSPLCVAVLTNQMQWAHNAIILSIFNRIVCVFVLKCTGPTGNLLPMLHHSTRLIKFIEITFFAYLRLHMQMKKYFH